MDWERSLPEQVNVLFTEWANRNEKPPYTEEQLVVMTLVCNEAPMTMEGIHEWLWERLRYYRKLAIKYWWNIGQHRQAEEDEVRKHKRRFLMAFYQFEVPIRTVKVNEDVCWTVSTSEARIYLRPIFEDAEKICDQPFPFMRLPSEIRLKIYELIFALPRVGVRFGKPQFGVCGDRRNEITTVERSHLGLEAHEAWFHKYSSGRQAPTSYSWLVSSDMKCDQPASLFAIFLVSRTVYKEAMPVFFDVNLFIFFDPRDMVDRLLSIPVGRRKHVRHVLLSIQTSPNHTSLLPRPGEFSPKMWVLHSCTSLAKVDVYVGGFQGWASPHPCRATAEGKMTSLMRILIILGLGRVKLLGDCAIVKERFAAELPKLEAVERLGRDMICA